MGSFLRRFAGVVLGVVSGFDRLVFKGRLPQLYSPHGMNCYASANHVRLLDFKKHTKEVTQRVLQSSLVESAKQAGRFAYLSSGKGDKEHTARAIGELHLTEAGWLAFLQCADPSWKFDTRGVNGRLTIRGERGKCSS